LQQRQFFFGLSGHERGSTEFRSLHCGQDFATGGMEMAISDMRND
jgi:hypothetical protein